MKTWLIILVFLCPLMLFSQDQSTVEPYTPKSVDSAKLLFERKVSAESAAFQVSGYFQMLSAYLAVRNDDLSVCKAGGECLRKANEDVLPMRYLAEGRCNEIKQEAWGEKEICRALKTNSCDSLPDWKGDLCRSLMSEDLNMLLKAGAKKGYVSVAGSRMTKETAGGILALYAGFKHYSILPCQRFMKDPLLPEQLSCEILFSPSGDSVFESMVRDIAIFNIAKKENNPDVCNSVKNSHVKKNCLNKKVKKLEDIW